MPSLHLEKGSVLISEEKGRPRKLLHTGLAKSPQFSVPVAFLCGCASPPSPASSPLGLHLHVKALVFFSSYSVLVSLIFRPSQGSKVLEGKRCVLHLLMKHAHAQRLAGRFGYKTGHEAQLWPWGLSAGRAFVSASTLKHLDTQCMHMCE